MFFSLHKLEGRQKVKIIKTFSVSILSVKHNSKGGGGLFLSIVFVLCNNYSLSSFKTIKRRKKIFAFQSCLCLKIKFFLSFLRKKHFQLLLRNELSNDDVKSYIDIAIMFFFCFQSVHPEG